MGLFRDIYKKTKHAETRLFQEVSESSDDIIHWIQKEEKKLKKRMRIIKNIKGVCHFVLLTGIIFV